MIFILLIFFQITILILMKGEMTCFGFGGATHTVLFLLFYFCSRNPLYPLQIELSDAFLTFERCVYIVSLH